MDHLSDMAIFVEVAKAGSFIAAARALKMPSSTVSRRIALLEVRLGLRLLNRTTRSVALTEPGRVYFGRVARIVAEAELAHEELEITLTKAEGLIRLSAPVDFSQRVLVPLMAAFIATHPEIRFSIDVSPRNVNLAADPFDLAIRMGPLPDSSMIARKVGTMALGLFAAPDLLARYPAVRGPADLARLPAIAFGGNPPLRTPAGQPASLSVVDTNNVGISLQLALLGVGIALLPIAFVESEVDSGHLATVLPSHRFEPTPVHVLTETRLLPARTRLFIEFLARKADAGFLPSSTGNS